MCSGLPRSISAKINARLVGLCRVTRRTTQHSEAAADAGIESGVTRPSEVLKARRGKVCKTPAQPGAKQFSFGGKVAFVDFRQPSFDHVAAGCQNCRHELCVKKVSWDRTSLFVPRG